MPTLQIEQIPEQNYPFGLGLNVGPIIGTAHSKARRNGIAGIQSLRRTQLSIAEDRPQFGVNSQKVVLVGAVWFRCVVDDLDR